MVTHVEVGGAVYDKSNIFMWMILYYRPRVYLCIIQVQNIYGNVRTIFHESHNQTLGVRTLSPYVVSLLLLRHSRDVILGGVGFEFPCLLQLLPTRT